ncbi:unnamed protein product [Amoebophrya sp. A25]|nr:unnamed protein product [Amoebophrya sp. A25]|eukprot:GSA25T00010649001.1
MRHDGLDIESVGSARDSPSDEGTPSDECGDSPGKDAEVHALLRRKHVSGKGQRDLGSAPSSAPSSLLKDERGNQETGGKKNRPRSTCDRRCCAFSWCRVGTITTILFLFSACLYFYHDAVLEFLGEKGSRIGQFYPFAAEPSSSTLQTSQEEVINCGLVTCGGIEEQLRSSSTASSSSAAAEEKAADQKAVGTSSTSPILGSGAADSSTGAADPSTGADSSTGAADPPSAVAAGDNRAADHSSGHGTSDHSTTDLHSTEPGADTTSDPRAGKGAGDGSRTSDTASKKQGTEEEKNAEEREEDEEARLSIAAEPEVSPAAPDLTQQEGTLDKDSLVDLDCLTTDNCKAIIRHPADPGLHSSGAEPTDIGIYMCPGRESATQQADRAIGIGSLFAGQKIRPPITCATFTKKFINDAANHLWAGKESSTTSPIFEKLGYDETRNGRQITWAAGVEADDACCRDSELSKDDSDTNWPPVFVGISIWGPPSCIPNPQKTCQWSVRDGEPSLHKFAGNVLCSGPKSGTSYLDNINAVVIETITEKIFPNRLGNVLFPMKEAKADASIRCEVITKGFVDENLLRPALENATPKSKRVRDWFARQSWSEQGVPSWSNSDETNDAVCCVNAEEERLRLRAQKMSAEANALKCEPIANRCMVECEARPEFTQTDALAEGAVYKEAGAFFCSRSSPVMQRQPDGIQNCASITRMLIDRVSKQNPPADSAWAEAFEQAAEHRDNVWKLRYEPGQGVTWERQGQNEDEPCCKESPSIGPHDFFK